jgi:phosphate transport system substrate-binding protein
VKRAGQSAAFGLLALLAACTGDVEEQVEPRSEQPTGVDPPTATEPAEKKQRTISWTGCDVSKKAYMARAAEEYEKLTGIRIVVTGGGATRGIRATAGGQSDIGGTCRHCLPADAEEETGAVMTHVAWDALVFFTHPDNPVGDISTDEAKKILTGKIRNWSDVGGPDAQIVPAFRRQTAHGKLSGVGYMTRLLLFGDVEQDYTNDALFHRSSGPIEQFVESTEFSFAVTGVSSAKKRKVKILSLDGVHPRDKHNIQSGAYRLFRPLYLVTKGEPTGETKKFLDWILSDTGQQVLSAAGTVNLAEGAKLKRLYGHWPADVTIRNH